MTFIPRVAKMTNENAYKLGFWDAYFIGKPDTDTIHMSEEAYDLYRLGFSDGVKQYAKDHREVA
jgi:hypothetical protein